MVDKLNSAIKDYMAQWEAFGAARTNKHFFAVLKPTSVAWKVADRAEFDASCALLRELSDQVHLGWVTKRWLATFHLRGGSLAADISLVKLMERRPGSTDAVGLDHLDFYLAPGTDAKEILAAETAVTWTEEKNGDHCKWLSVWFAATEAKLRSDTVLDVCIAELQDMQPPLVRQQEQV